MDKRISSTWLGAVLQSALLPVILLLLVWLLTACGGGGSDSSATTASSTTSTGTATSTGSSSTTSTSTTCSTIPSETAGPYPGDGTNSNGSGVANALTLSGIVRSQIPGHNPAHEKLPALAAEWFDRYDAGYDVTHWYTAGKQSAHV